MKQNLKCGLIFLCLCCVAVVLYLLRPSENKELSEEKSPDRVSRSHDSMIQESMGNVPPVKESLSTEQLRKIELAKDISKSERMKKLISKDYNMPIDFWGKVIDQDGKPLVGVKAEITVDEHAGKIEYVVFSDESGLFVLLNKRGARARVKVSLSGYAPTTNDKIGTRISARTIYYAAKAMPSYAPPTKDNPQIFVLRKKNTVANLAHASEKRVFVGKTGIPRKIELKTEWKTFEVEVRCWSSSPVPFTYDKYDWRAEIQITGGKLQTITEVEPITAPLNGYQKVFKIEMPKDTEKTWKSTNIRQREFWVQFEDGIYAKARIEVKTGRKHEVDVEILYNLDKINNFEL